MIKIIQSWEEMQSIGIQLMREKQSHGFVPTMGALHEGHLSLVKESIKENHINTVSIYVNPTQFGANEDLSKYPRTFEKDMELLEELNGVNYCFFPSDSIMYPRGYQTYVQNEIMSQVMCGVSRPVHFKGVTTIVSKLLNIVMPTISYFGQKDYQQYLIIKQMVADLNMPVQIKALPIVREADGLAMSSRNKYLTKPQREQAVCLYKALQYAQQKIKEGIFDVNRLKEMLHYFFNEYPLAKVDYIEIRDSNNLDTLDTVKDQALLALAVYFNSTRLIDNAVLSIQ